MSDRVEQWRNDTPGCATRIHLNNAGAALMPTPVLQAMQTHLALERARRLRGRRRPCRSGRRRPRRRGRTRRRRARHVAFTAAPPPPSSRRCRLRPAARRRRGDHPRGLHVVPDPVPVAGRASGRHHHPRRGPARRRRRPAVGARHPARTRCRLVHVSWIPTHSGLVQDVAAVGAVCEEAGVPYLVDACQAVGQMPIDVAALKCDYLTATAREFLRGPRGIGFPLRVRPRAAARRSSAVRRHARRHPGSIPALYRLAETAARFEEWEFAYALVPGPRCRGESMPLASASRWRTIGPGSWRRGCGRCWPTYRAFGCSIPVPGLRRIVTASLGRPAGAGDAAAPRPRHHTSATLRVRPAAPLRGQ